MQKSRATKTTNHIGWIGLQELMGRDPVYEAGRKMAESRWLAENVPEDLPVCGPGSCCEDCSRDFALYYRLRVPATRRTHPVVGRPGSALTRTRPGTRPA